MRWREEGFTLIELMVVVLIVGILLVIAIPTFLGVRERAQDRDAQTLLRNALQTEKTFYVDKQAYTQVKAELTALEPGIAYDAVADAVPSTDSVAYAVSGGTVTLATRSDSGTCFYLRDNPVGGSTFAEGGCERPSTTGNPFSAGGWR